MESAQRFVGVLDKEPVMSMALVGLIEICIFVRFLPCLHVYC